MPYRLLAEKPRDVAKHDAGGQHGAVNVRAHHEVCEEHKLYCSPVFDESDETSWLSRVISSRYSSRSRSSLRSACVCKTTLWLIRCSLCCSSWTYLRSARRKGALSLNDVATSGGLARRYDRDFCLPFLGNIHFIFCTVLSFHMTPLLLVVMLIDWPVPHSTQWVGKREVQRWSWWRIGHQLTASTRPACLAHHCLATLCTVGLGMSMRSVNQSIKLLNRALLVR